MLCIDTIRRSKVRNDKRKKNIDMIISIRYQNVVLGCANIKAGKIVICKQLNKIMESKISLNLSFLKPHYDSDSRPNAIKHKP